MIRYYCADCGHHVELSYEDRIGYCPICDRIVTKTNAITKMPDDDSNEIERVIHNEHQK